MQQDNKKSNALQGIMGSRKAAADFLRAGRRKELKDDGGFDLHYRFRNMSDDDFYKGVADGSITPEQIRKAGEYAHDVYMGDVWTEQDENWDKPEPTYDEFIADPAKYGYEEDTEFPERLYRYKPGVAQGVINAKRIQEKQ